MDGLQKNNRMTGISFVGRRRTWFIISAILIAASIASLAIFGLKLNIDFVGGSLIEVQFKDQAPSNQELGNTLETAGFSNVVIQPSGDKKIILRMETLTEDQHQTVLKALDGAYKGVQEDRFDSIGPVIGKELQRTSIYGVVVTLILIGLYIAWAFRKVTEPVESWKYGLLTVLCAFHDVIVPVGVFAIFGHFFNWEIGSAFIAAVLTILGYSISDTVVVFDRTRENLLRRTGESFGETVEKSIRQTYVRSINTSLTTILAMIAIFLLGGESTRPFALALLIGIAVGTYSSIFIASPALVAWNEWNEKRRA